MNRIMKILLGGIAIALVSNACGADEDVVRSLILHCQYSDYKSFQSETISVTQATETKGEPASVKTFLRGNPNQQEVVLRIYAGQFAECVYPSGNRVRVKVGEGTARAYGMCGGDPQIFASVWINKRKILSRDWFAGHCLEESNSSTFSLKVLNSNVARCKSVNRLGSPNSTVESEATLPPKLDPLTVCVDFPEVARFPLDQTEYPPRGVVPAAVGSQEVVRGKHPVCELVSNALRLESTDPINTEVSELQRPEWKTPLIELPKELAGGLESVFDFDNDGSLDRIFSRYFESNYMHGSVLLVQPGKSRRQLRVKETLLDSTSVLVPCQMGMTSKDIGACAPFSQKSDDAGFQMETRKGDKPVYFRARYAEVVPFRFRASTYIQVKSHSEDTREYVAVLKPLPNRRSQPTCLIRKIPENF